MEKREALKTLILDILSDPGFDRELGELRLMKNARPLSPMGSEIQKKGKEIHRNKVASAELNLFDE